MVLLKYNHLYSFMNNLKGAISLYTISLVYVYEL